MSCNVRSRNRVFYLVILIICCTQLCFAVNGQETGIPDKRVTIAAKNTSLGFVLKKLAKVSGITIFFSTAEIAPFNNVSVNVKNTPFSEVMRELLDVRGLTAIPVNETAVTVTKKVMPPAPAISANTVDTIISVSGKVISETGTPIVAATISLNGSKRGTTTSADGTFTLSEVPKSASLTISSVSYLTQYIAVRGRSNIGAIALKEYVSELDETVIKGFYNTTKRLSTSNIVTIKGEDIAKQPVSNPLVAMMGRVPNLVINPTSGLPNGAIDLQLRGQNSLNTGAPRSEPLIIIDGVPYQNNIDAGALGSFGPINKRLSTLSLININDIESVSVLTDADATSIYGSRGGNGVILITTKKSKPGAPSINLSLTTGMSRVSNKLALLNTTEYIQLRRQAYTNDGLPIPRKDEPNKNYSNYDLTVWDSARYTDWQKTFFGESAPSYSANLSIGGGSQEIQYMLSAGYNTQKYVYPGSNKYETGNVNLSINHNAANGKFKTLLTGSYNFNNSQSPLNDLTRLAVMLAPNAPSIYTSSGGLNWEPNPESQTNESTWNNPYATLLKTSTLQNNNLRGTVDISYEVMPNLLAKVVAGYSEVHSRSLGLTPIASFDPANTTATGTAIHTNVIAKSLTVDPQLNYSLKFGESKIDALLGASLQHQNTESETVYGVGYTSDALLKSMGQASTTFTANNTNEYKYAGVFGRLSYNYAGKYLLNLTGRRDGSSRFGPGYQFGNFWSTGLAWIFTEEELTKKAIPALSFGKLRFSYGTSGNDGIGDYRYVELYEGIPNLTYQNTNLISSVGVTNPYYHWEKVRKLELGLEIGFFKDRVLATISRWHTRCSDQLGQLPLPATGGGISITANQDATIQNSGWDFLLSTRNIVSKSFSWTTSANFGIQHNKLISKPERLFNDYNLNRFVTAGQPFSGFAIVYTSKGVSPATGQYMFSDRSGNVSTDKDNGFWDAKKINTVPLTLGISNSLSYKGFTIDFFVQLTKQMGRNHLFDPIILANNAGYFSSEPGAETGNLPKEYINHWKEVGDLVAFQKLTSRSSTEPLGQLLSKARESDLAWVDASFIRLRNVSLSFEFPDTWKQKVKLKNFLIYLQAQNLVTITDYKGLDPEIQSATSLPLLRTVAAGIRIGL